ncbi:MAG: signal peptidase I [Oscillospiraceae bacterium]|nr:signal peptidase I [Oscillospiraceae bacterium]
MSEEKRTAIDIPSAEQVEAELERIRYRRSFLRTLLNTAAIVAVVAALSVLLSVIFFPVIQVSGDSMTPTLSDGDILVTCHTDKIAYGDLCCVSWQNKTLLKRVIGLPGDVITIESDGSVYVNQELLDEPYVIEKSSGDCDISFPYEVPDNKIFILGDNRTLSVDSRNSDIGCIGKEQIIGKVLFRIRPFGNS